MKSTPQFQQILGLRFFVGNAQGAIAAVSQHGGLVVVPAAPALKNLAIDKSHTGGFTIGVNGVYTLAVSNTGGAATTRGGGGLSVGMTAGTLVGNTGGVAARCARPAVSATRATQTSRDSV